MGAISKLPVKLPLTKEGKVDFPALFSPLPPSPQPEPELKERDEFETKEEFLARKVEFERGVAERAKEFSMRLQEFETYRYQLIGVFNQAVARHDPLVQAGIAYLEKRNYKVNEDVLIINLEWADWLRELFALEMMTKINVVRDDAKALFEEGRQKNIFVTLKMNCTQKTILDIFFLGLGREMKLPIKSPQIFIAHDTLRNGSVGPELVWVPGGTFQMGNSYGDSKTNPIHEVSLKGFSMGKYEVTIEEYLACVHSRGCNSPEWLGSNSSYVESYKKIGISENNKRHPIVGISLNDAKQYVKWLSEQTGKDYRLPSEAQWEYACRAGSAGKFSFGDDVNLLGNYGWYDKNSNSQTHPVGEKQPARSGLYDMHGNVWEWLDDIKHDSYLGSPTDGSAWTTNGDSNYNIIRGGTWSSSDKELSCTHREWSNNTLYRYNHVGFRVSRM